MYEEQLQQEIIKYKSGKKNLNKILELTKPHITNRLDKHCSDFGYLNIRKRFWDDLFQDCYLFVTNRIDKYSPDKNIPFHTYMSISLDFFIPDKIREYNTSGMCSGKIARTKNMKLSGLVEGYDQLKNDLSFVGDERDRHDNVDEFVNIAFDNNPLDTLIFSLLTQCGYNGTEVAYLLGINYNKIRTVKDKGKQFYQMKR